MKLGGLGAHNSVHSMTIRRKSKNISMEHRTLTSWPPACFSSHIPANLYNFPGFQSYQLFSLTFNFQKWYLKFKALLNNQTVSLFLVKCKLCFQNETNAKNVLGTNQPICLKNAYNKNNTKENKTPKLDTYSSHTEQNPHKPG